MSVQAFHVSEDWSQISSQMRRERLYAGLVILVVVIFSTALVAVFDRLALSVAWSSFLVEAVSLCLYGAVAIGYALRPHARMRIIAAGVYGAGLVLMAVTNWLTKSNLRVRLVDSPRAQNPVLYAGIIMLLYWVVLIGLTRRFPAEMRKIGLTGVRWAAWSVVGALTGLILGGHLLFTATTAGLVLTFKPWPYTLWSLGYEAGIQSITEELFFRGVVFNYLYRVEERNFWLSAIVTSFLNVTALIVKAGWSSNLLLSLGTLFYAFAMSMISAALFSRSRSIVPAFANNVAFSMATMFL
ncbi:MAG: CPBP family glutamic-type intramembrane protease [Anaerolineae bacterium]|nr:CPBP family glutamic-type intramembrane protease [Anaerolineae bacterium]